MKSPQHEILEPKPCRNTTVPSALKPFADAPIAHSLCELAAGERAIIHDSVWQAENSVLLESYGFFPGSAVTRIGSAPQGDPLIFRLDRRLVAVRRETAANILVVREIK